MKDKENKKKIPCGFFFTSLRSVWHLACTQANSHSKLDCFATKENNICISARNNAPAKKHEKKKSSLKIMNANNYIIYLKKKKSGIENNEWNECCCWYLFIGLKEKSGGNNNSRRIPCKWICECAFRFSNSMNGRWMNVKSWFFTMQTHISRPKTHVDAAQHSPFACIYIATKSHTHQTRTQKYAHTKCKSVNSNRTGKREKKNRTTIRKPSDQTAEENNLTSTFIIIIRATLRLF